MPHPLGRSCCVCGHAAAVPALTHQNERGHSAHSHRGNIAPAPSCAQSHLARGALAIVSVRDDSIATTAGARGGVARAQRRFEEHLRCRRSRSPPPPPTNTQKYRTTSTSNTSTAAKKRAGAPAQNTAVEQHALLRARPRARCPDGGRPSVAFALARPERPTSCARLILPAAKDTLAERLRRRPAKPMGSPRVGSNPTGVDLIRLQASGPFAVSQLYGYRSRSAPMDMPQAFRAGIARRAQECRSGCARAQHKPPAGIEPATIRLRSACSTS